MSKLKSKWLTHVPTIKQDDTICAMRIIKVNEMETKLEMLIDPYLRRHRHKKDNRILPSDGDEESKSLSNRELKEANRYVGERAKRASRENDHFEHPVGATT